jgi:hypothetical protein
MAAQCHALTDPDGDESNPSVGGGRAVITLAVVVMCHLGLLGGVVAAIA